MNPVICYLASLDIEELRRQHLLCMSGNEYSLASTQALILMLQYGLLTKEEFTYINK